METAFTQLNAFMFVMFPIFLLVIGGIFGLGFLIFCFDWQEMKRYDKYLRGLHYNPRTNLLKESRFKRVHVPDDMIIGKKLH